MKRTKLFLSLLAFSSITLSSCYINLGFIEFGEKPTEENQDNNQDNNQEQGENKPTPKPNPDVPSGGDYIRDDYGDYYATITDDAEGDTLKNLLNTLNTSMRKRTMGYDGLKTWGQYTEIDWTGKENVEGKMFGFYDNALVSNTWDNQATWNREHVWPNSLGGGKVEKDMHMPRPTSVSINSERGNKYYGSSGGTYDPGQYEANYRGVAARIIFYCAIADTSLSLIDANSGSGSMGKLSDLLRWNLEYAPNRHKDAPLTLRIEQNRNHEMFTREGLQGNRNPFIDHPEYACRIWGNTNSATRSACKIS